MYGEIEVKKEKDREAGKVRKKKFINRKTETHKVGKKGNY
jgi:hypothetical protein